MANRRLAISILGNKLAVERLFKEIAPRISSRNGGYTRIMKHGFRVGDKAPMAIMELVDRIEIVQNIEKIVEQKTA